MYYSGGTRLEKCTTSCSHYCKALEDMLVEASALLPRGIYTYQAKYWSYTKLCCSRVIY